ncbi:DEAD/DEAH box helicase [archaeon]|nr:MAG: DEAD/DEAH box helicase [archaeon]
MVTVIAPTKTLLNQQVDYIQKQCSEKVKAVVLNGDKTHEGLEIDSWDTDQWQFYFQHYEVLGMTPEVLCNLLEKTILPGDAIDLLVLDECHHVICGKDPMARLCENIRVKGYQPLMLGLTASPLTKKNKKILDAYANMQTRMDAKIFVPSPDMLLSLQHHVSEAKIVVQEYSGLVDAVLTQFTSLLRYALHLQEVIIAAHSDIDRGCYALVRDNLPDVFASMLAQPDHTLVCVRKLTDLSRNFSQVETVLDDSGPYCGLLALVVMLQNNHLLCDMRALSFSELCNKTQSIYHQVITEQCKALNTFAEQVSSADCDLLRHQRVCVLQVLLRLAKKILNKLLAHEEEGRLQALTNTFTDASAHNLTPFGLWFVRRIAERRPVFSAEDITSVQGILTLAGFFLDLCAYFTHILEHIDIHPLLACLTINGTAECRLVSSKMMKLLQLLVRFLNVGDEAMNDLQVIPTPSPSSSPSPLSTPPSSPSTVTISVPTTASVSNVAIVFCKMRLTVQVLDKLSHLLDSASSTTTQLKSAYITGSDNEANQTTALRKLRCGEVNVLFATDVVKEGVDIKSCNLVVNYDGPATAKSHIQRKGRARVLNAHIVHILPEPYDEQKDYEDIVKFIAQEREASEEIHNCMKLLSTQVPDSERYIVESTQASVDGTAAFSIIHEYCVRLKSTTSREVFLLHL